MIPPAVRAIFRAPFHALAEVDYVLDADNHTVASNEEPWIPRGWGRIQYLADPEGLSSLWAATYRSVVGDEADKERIAALLTAAWT